MKTLLSILLIFIIWYLVFALLEVEFNPLEWTKDGKLYFIWLLLGSVLAYGVFSVKP